MKLNNDRACLQEVLCHIDEKQLEKMLHEELDKSKPNEVIVQEILRVMHDRVETDVETNVSMVSDYVENINQLRQETKERVNHPAFWRIAAIISIVLLIGLFVPHNANADGFWDVLVRWTNNIVEFFSIEDTPLADVSFHSDNEGLSELYEMAEKIGIKDPMIPTWLPAQYILENCEVIETSRKHGIISVFKFQEDELSIKIDFYNSIVSHKFYKSNGDIEEIEINGIIFIIFQNNSKWVTVWSKDNVEYSISIGCQKDVLFEILGSIYNMEELK